jgi:hypothetical protein
MNLDSRQPLDRSESLCLLSTVKIGRIAISISARPALVPVDFVVLGEHVVFRAERQSQLLRGVLGAVVAFESGSSYLDKSGRWSVQVRGVPVELGPQNQVDSTIRKWQSRWAGPSDDAVLVALSTDVMSGWSYVDTKDRNSR